MLLSHHRASSALRDYRTSLVFLTNETVLPIAEEHNGCTRWPSWKSTVQYSSVSDGLTCSLYDLDRERSPESPGMDARAQAETSCPALAKALMTQSQQELERERRWELYRRSVVESMPESDYRTAVLAGIAHKLKMLDRMEASRSPLIEKAAGTRTDQSRALTRAATARNGWNGGS
jgi:hypothetical protein